MRQGTNPKRSRGRGGGRKVHNPRSHVFDSNGPSVRIRGSAMQIYEKYAQMARDAQGTDRIASENLAQHAEHYYRVANANNTFTNGADRRSHHQGRQGQEGGSPPEGNGQDIQASQAQNDGRQRHERAGSRPDQRTAPQTDGNGAQASTDSRGTESPVARAPVVEATAAAADEPSAVAADTQSAEAQPPDDQSEAAQPTAAATEKPPRRRRSPGRPRKSEAAPADPSDDTEPVQA